MTAFVYLQTCFYLSFKATFNTPESHDYMIAGMGGQLGAEKLTGILHKFKSYAHAPFSMLSAIFPVGRRGRMKQQ